MFEHAKWKYLHCAKLAINADTDELLWLKDTTLDQMVDTSLNSSDSVWIYKAVWIEPVDSVTGNIAENVSMDQRRFENYWHTNHNEQRGIGIKWMLVPQKNMQFQWRLHDTSGPSVRTDKIGFGHYLAMNTSWSWKRDGYQGDKSTLEVYAPTRDNFDTWLAKRGY
jgi:hypothetical protein